MLTLCIDQATAINLSCERSMWIRLKRVSLSRLAFDKEYVLSVY